jgi:hypothetical protein
MWHASDLLRAVIGGPGALATTRAVGRAVVRWERRARRRTWSALRERLRRGAAGLGQSSVRSTTPLISTLKLFVAYESLTCGKTSAATKLELFAGMRVRLGSLSLKAPAIGAESLGKLVEAVTASSASLATLNLKGTGRCCLIGKPSTKFLT